MFCRKCGKQIPDGAQFCPYCGANLSTVPGASPAPKVQEPKNPVHVQPAPAPRPPKAPKQPKAPMDPEKKKKIIIGGVVAGVIVAAAVFVSTRPETLTPVTSVAPSYTGVNGHASVTADDIVYSEEEQKIEARLDELQDSIYNLENLESSNAKQLASTIKEGSELDALTSAYSCSWLDSEGNELEQGSLSNGDVITYSCKYEDPDTKVDVYTSMTGGSRMTLKQVVADLGYSLKDYSQEFTVAGLGEAQEIDLFEGLTAKYAYSYDWGADVSIDLEPKSITIDGTDYGYSVDTIDYDAGTYKVYVNGINADTLLEKGYIAKDDKFEEEINIGAPPQIVTSTTLDEVKTAVRTVTDQLLQNDVNGCGMKLTQSATWGHDESTVDFWSYEFDYIKNSGNYIYAYYRITLYNPSRKDNENVYERGYQTVVWKLADGSYDVQYVGNQGKGNSSCYGNYGEWNN